MKKSVFKLKETDLSSEESKKRIEKIIEKQKRIRYSSKVTLEQMRKITFTI